jgi:hypothetical protein
MSRDDKPKADTHPEIIDEPGMAERFQRGLRNLINTPPQPRKPSAPKPKQRSASKGAFTRGGRETEDGIAI